MKTRTVEMPPSDELPVNPDCRGPVAPSNATRNTMIGAVLLALITLLLYAPAATFSFVSFDDGLHLYRDPYMQDPSAATIARFWQSPYAELYVPVAYSLWSAIRYSERHFFHNGLFHPQLYHAVNIGLHILNVILLFRILLLLGNMPYGAFAGALLFAIHPVQVESVAWISEMRGLVAAAFSLLAIHISLKSSLQAQHNPTYSRKASIAAHIVATTSFALALLAKPNAVVLPVMYAALCLFYKSKTTQRRILSTALLWLCISVPITVVTQIAQAASARTYITPFLLRPLVMLDSCGFYIIKLLLPLNCTIDYGRQPDTLLTTPAAYIGTTLLAVAVAAAVVLFRKRYPVLVPGSIIVLAGILPVSGIVPFRFQVFSTVTDRYLYLPLIGIAIIVAAMPFNRLSRYVRIAMCIFALLLLLRSFLLLGVWKDDNALYTHALRVNPRSFIGANNLAAVYGINGNWEMAETLYRRAATIDPDRAAPYASLAGIAAKQHNIPKAMALIGSAIERAPLEPQYYERRAALHMENGDRAQAGIDLIRARQLREAKE